MDRPPATERLVEELTASRNGLLAALAAVSPDSMTTPGLSGQWSGREIIAHLGYWAGHAVEAIHSVELGRHREEEQEPEPAVDGVNEAVARVARTTPLAMVRRREAASVEALIDRLRSLDPALLSERLPDGDTLADAIRDDGADHYRQHAEELRRTLGAAPDG